MGDQYLSKAKEIAALDICDNPELIVAIADALREAEERGFAKARSAGIAAVERMPTPKIALFR